MHPLSCSLASSKRQPSLTLLRVLCKTLASRSTSAGKLREMVHRAPELIQVFEH
jgi:hypothetical protein